MDQPAVCMVVASYPPHGGGSERQCALLARRLAGLGVGVTVLTRRLDPASRSEMENGVAIHRLGAPGRSRWLQAAVFLLAVMQRLLRERRRYRIVHCHGFEPLALTGVFAQRLLGKRLVIKVVTSGSFGDVARLSALPGARSIARQLLRADRVILLNEETRQELLGLGAEAAKLVLIPNGVDIPPVSRQPDAPNALYCGRLVAQKNVEGLLRAWARTRAAGKRGLDIAGDGPEREKLIALARDLGIEGCVHFHGRVSDVAPLHRRAACLVLFSHAEGLSNVVLEALAAGVPVIGSDIPGIREVVHHEKTGILVPAGDEAALATSIDRLIEEPGLAERISVAGRELVQRDYDIAAIARRVQALYEQLATP